ncbi:helix-turn-helix domain-containing protein [Mesorhizobium sp. NBSH29]|uniref:HTH-type transcriptional regulator BhcR n=1 Tax=Mesorhizobium sp. NBSH29 TaxID=2654249 RepID=UPI0018965560|nr:HTH-type transcriptional regulator BhcR [Mesorhizobium sp. NBSH29]QPC87657.1 helix-turn-helix domain-containing protein [Mesorhizobium sp. NBSH29]
MPLTEKRQRGRPRAFKVPVDAGPVQALDRALRVLSVVAEGDGLSLSELAAAAELAPSTAYRMLTTLEAHKMVEFEPGPQLWSIGVGTYRMGSAFLRRRKLADRARSIMQALMEETGETANLGVAEEDGVVFISQVETHEAIRAFFRPGTAGSFHASGIGKAILAHLAEPRRAALLARNLPAYTLNTLTEAGALAENLSAIRQRGYAVDDEERNAGMRCIASAIFNEFGEPIAGISISGPTVRVTPEQVLRFGPLVRTAAATVTALIGGVVP